MSQQTVILLLGTNIGDRKKNLNDAKLLIENNVGDIVKVTEILETIPIEFCSSNYFYNFAMLINTKLSPFQLLKSLKKIEQDMGRIQDSSVIGEYTDRIIDIDIVEYSNLSYDCKSLKIPHLKHLNEREFSKKLINLVKA